MGLIEAKAHLSKFGKAESVLEFDVPTHTVLEAAAAIGTKPERIAKTLSFIVNNQPILIVMAGDAKVDNNKYKNIFSVKAKMLPPEQVIELIGHAIGGVCPFGVNKGVNIYLDRSLTRFDYVYPACGSANSCIKVTLNELEHITGCNEYIDISKEIL